MQQKISGYCSGLQLCNNTCSSSAHLAQSIMRSRRLQHIAFLALAIAGHCSAEFSPRSSETLRSAPLFVWSSAGHALREGATQLHDEDLQVHTSLGDVIAQLLPEDLIQPPGAENGQRPEVILAVLGSQLKTSHLKNRAMQSSLQPLKALLATAASSLTVPYVLHDAVDHDRHVDFMKLATEKHWETLVVGCSQHSAGSLDDVLQQQPRGPVLILVCTQPALPSMQDVPEAVAAELRQVQEAHDMVAKLGRQQLTLYAAVPSDGSHPAGRQLLELAADVGTCGQLCQTQVKWLEGILAAFIMAIAAFSGMCCLYMLDTPTRFEKPKEGIRND